MTRDLRRSRFVRPKLQLKLIGGFLGVAALALLLQFVLVTMTIGEIAAEVSGDGRLLVESAVPRALLALGLSFLVLLPLSLLVGILLTFRVAGPLHRIESHLTAIARGEDPGECRIRKDDELQELCSAVNGAVASLKSRASRATASRAQDVERAA